MINLIQTATVETLLMVGSASLIGVVVGLPIGLIRHLTHPTQIMPYGPFHVLIGFVANLLRSIPYIILIILLIPVTRVLVGSSIGLGASIVPLSLAAVLLIARMAEDTFKTVSMDLVEMGLAMGASRMAIIRHILLAESLPTLIRGFTNVLILLVGFSAMSGAVGGGGLGDLAIRYGYQRYDVAMLMAIVLILIGLVQLIQMVGDHLAKKVTH